MERRVIEDDDLALERKSLIPGEGFFVPDDVQREVRDEEIRERAEGASVIVVADPDADGLACVATVREAYGEAALVPAGPHDLDEGIRRAAEFGEPGARVFVCDLCPDDPRDVADLPDLVADSGEVRWFDHHQWEPEMTDLVREAGVDLVVGDSESECTADVAVRSIDVDLPDRFAELAAVTRDHDLWLREDPRSDDLADFAYWAEDEDEYVETVREHGANLPEDVAAFLAEQRVEKDALIERAVDRGEIREVGEFTVGVTYGRCSQNEVAEAFREQGADASVVVKPSGAASIRGTDAFQRCHLVARRVNGGGHPKAAGCKPDVYDDMLDYAHHWVTQGAATKQVILDAFRTVVEETDAESDAE
jgi:oligoribonuclease NrnB/cAMP/cGMP phosphodiesterase (DHH superfamily)